MDVYCDNRHCRRYRQWMADPGPYCFQCGSSYYHGGRYDHHNQHRYGHSRRDQESWNIRDLVPYRSRSRSREYGRTYHYSSDIQESRDHHHDANHYGYDGRPLPYAHRESYRERTPSPSYRPRERSYHEYSRERSTPPRDRRSERRCSSSSRYRTYERSPYESNRRRTPSPTYRDRDRYYESRRRSSSSAYRPRSRHSDRESIDDHKSNRRGDRYQEFEPQHGDQYRGQRALMASNHNVRAGFSAGHTPVYEGYGDRQHIPRERHSVYEADDRRYRGNLEQLRIQGYQSALNYEEQHELIPYVPTESSPRSTALPWSERHPEQEFGIHGEDFDLKDIRQKRFINCGIECPQCKKEGYEADHPRFACGTMFEIFTHYVGERLRNKHEWCQICRKEGRFNISKHHSTEDCKFGMWCDHPANDSVKQNAKFRKWNYPYPSDILGYEPGTVSQMFRDMEHRQRGSDD